MYPVETHHRWAGFCFFFLSSFVLGTQSSSLRLSSDDLADKTTQFVQRRKKNHNLTWIFKAHIVFFLCNYSDLQEDTMEALESEFRVEF